MTLSKFLRNPASRTLPFTHPLLLCSNAMQGDEAEDSRLLHASTSRPGSSSGTATGGSSTKLKIRFGGSKTGSIEPQNRHDPAVATAPNGSVRQQHNGGAESPMEMDLDSAGQAAAAMAQKKREEAIAEQQRKRQGEEAEAGGPSGI